MISAPPTKRCGRYGASKRSLRLDERVSTQRESRRVLRSVATHVNGSASHCQVNEVGCDDWVRFPGPASWTTAGRRRDPVIAPLGLPQRASSPQAGTVTVTGQVGKAIGEGLNGSAAQCGTMWASPARRGYGGPATSITPGDRSVAGSLASGVAATVAAKSGTGIRGRGTARLRPRRGPRRALATAAPRRIHPSRRASV